MFALLALLDIYRTGGLVYDKGAGFDAFYTVDALIHSLKHLLRARSPHPPISPPARPVCPILPSLALQIHRPATQVLRESLKSLVDLESSVAGSSVTVAREMETFGAACRDFAKALADADVVIQKLATGGDVDDIVRKDSAKLNLVVEGNRAGLESTLGRIAASLAEINEVGQIHQAKLRDGRTKSIITRQNIIGLAKKLRRRATKRAREIADAAAKAAAAVAAAEENEKKQADETAAVEKTAVAAAAAAAVVAAKAAAELAAAEAQQADEAQRAEDDQLRATVQAAEKEAAAAEAAEAAEAEVAEAAKIAKAAEAAKVAEAAEAAEVAAAAKVIQAAEDTKTKKAAAEKEKAAAEEKKTEVEMPAQQETDAIAPQPSSGEIAAAAQDDVVGVVEAAPSEVGKAEAEGSEVVKAEEENVEDEKKKHSLGLLFL